MPSPMVEDHKSQFHKNNPVALFMSIIVCLWKAFPFILRDRRVETINAMVSPKSYSWQHLI